MMRIFHKLLLLLVSFSCRVVAQSSSDHEEIDYPPMLDSDDIAYFFQRRDMAGLHQALQSVFRRSQRNPVADQVVYPLPEQMVARGGGFHYTAAYKMQHDLEQAAFLANYLQGKEAAFFRDTVVPAYQSMLERIPPLEDLERTQGLYPFQAADRQATNIHTLYNKALHLANLDKLAPDVDSGEPAALINPDLDVSTIQRQWTGQDVTHVHPGIVVVDNLLSPKALAAMQQIMLESTVFTQCKLPKKFGGYVGAYIDDGLHDRILLDLAMDLHDSMPDIFAGQPLKYLWSYKYDSNYTGINLHADQAAVNVNIWLTPDSSNLDPDSGGLVIFTARPPPTWGFQQYNTDTDFVREQLLQPTAFANVTVPYKANRAVIFDSALFHQTDNFVFRQGYENRRINLTLLYGDMQVAPQKDQADEL